jgi:hypothetical protein
MAQKYVIIQEPGTTFKTYIPEGNYVPDGWTVVATDKTEAQAKATATPLVGS